MNMHTRLLTFRSFNTIIKHTTGTTVDNNGKKPKLVQMVPCRTNWFNQFFVKKITNFNIKTEEHSMRLYSACKWVSDHTSATQPLKVAPAQTAN